MGLFYDIGLDEDGDLDISTGDITIVLSDEDHIQDILRAFTGWWRNFPFIGVGIIQYVESDGNYQQLVQNAKTQLTADGYIINVFNPTVVDGQFIIDTDCSRS